MSSNPFDQEWVMVDYWQGELGGGQTHYTPDSPVGRYPIIKIELATEYWSGSCHAILRGNDILEYHAYLWFEGIYIEKFYKGLSVHREGGGNLGYDESIHDFHLAPMPGQPPPPPIPPPTKVTIVFVVIGNAFYASSYLTESPPAKIIPQVTYLDDETIGGFNGRGRAGVQAWAVDAVTNIGQIHALGTYAVLVTGEQIPAKSNTYIAKNNSLSSYFMTWGYCIKPFSNDSAGITDGFFADNGFDYLLTTEYSLSIPIPISDPNIPETPYFSIDGVAIKVASINPNGVSGTITVALDDGNGTMAGSETSCLVSDLDTNGWFFFKSTGPVNPVLVKGLSYIVKVKTSEPNQVYIKCTSLAGATGGNVKDMCVLVRTDIWYGVPVGLAGQFDNMYIMGEINQTLNSDQTIGPAVIEPRTVTWDNSVDGYPFNMMTISKGGTLNIENVSDKNYSMRLAQDFKVYSNGVVNIGTKLNPIVSSSSFTLVFEYIQGLIIYPQGIFQAYGSPKMITSSLVNVAGIGSTSIVIQDTTGWGKFDELIFTSDSIDPTEAETVIITSIVDNTASISSYSSSNSGLQFARSGNVFNLTRNVIIQGGSEKTVQSYILNYNGSIFIANYTEFKYLGSTLPLTKGISIAYFNSLYCYSQIAACSIHDCFDGATGILIDGLCDNCQIDLEYNLTWNIDGNHILNNSTLPNCIVNVFSNTFILNSIDNQPIIDWFGIIGTITFNTITSGLGDGIIFRSPIINTTISNNIVHSCANNAITLVEPEYIAITNLTTQYCDTGISIVNDVIIGQITIDSWISLDNTTQHLVLGDVFAGMFSINDSNLQSGPTVHTPIGIKLGRVASTILINNTSINGHTSGDIVIQPMPTTLIITMQNSVLGNVVGQEYLANGSEIDSDRHNQIDGNYKSWKQYANIERDSIIYRNAPNSIRVTPINLLEGGTIPIGPFQVVTLAGNTASFSIQIRKSTLSDGAEYSRQALLLVTNNNSVSKIPYTIIATSVAANGQWETLSGSVGPVAVDCIVSFYLNLVGTGTGWINIDSATSDNVKADIGGTSFAAEGQPFIFLGTGGRSVIETTTTYTPIPARKVVQ